MYVKAGLINNNATCEPCGLQHYQPLQNQIQCEKCRNGTFINSRGNVKCNEVEHDKQYLQPIKSCSEKGCTTTYKPTNCPPLGIISEAKCFRGELEYFTGYWHDGLQRATMRSTRKVLFMHRSNWSLNRATAFYTCPCRDCCAVDKSTGIVECKHGTDGLLCSLCNYDHYKEASGVCHQCTDADRNMLGGIVCLGIALLLVVIARSSIGQRIRKSNTFQVPYQVLESIGIVTMLKIVFSFYQVCCGMYHTICITPCITPGCPTGEGHI